MQKLCVLFVLAIIANEAIGMTFRHKRQSDSSDEDNLEDKYGQQEQFWDNQPWNRPNQPPFPNQGQWPFPNPGGQPNQRPPRPTSSTTQTPNGNGSTTQSSTVTACIRNCPVTPEYNPVCGTNLVTYNNPGMLGCAQACGVTVNLLRSSRCPATTPAPAPAAAPAS